MKGKIDANGQIFTNNAYVDDEQARSDGILNHRRRYPDNELYRTLDSMASEIDGENYKKERANKEKIKQDGGQTSVQVPEELKGRKYRELSVMEIEELGEINASQDRFRHRFHEDDYKNDVINANIRWVN